jgi:hypothetical protein
MTPEVGVEHERARPATGGAGFADAVTYGFGDAAADVFGLVRLGLSSDGASLLVVLFAGSEPVLTVAEGGLSVSAETDWASFAAGAAATTVEEPLRRWRVSYEPPDGDSLDALFEARSGPAAATPAVVAAGGMDGYEQLCRVRGRARLGGRAIALDGVGQRGHAWGEPDWSRLALARSISVWGTDGSGALLTAIRSQKAKTHRDETLGAAVVRAGEAVAVDEPRLSTTYDAHGHQRRAGLELWVRDSDTDAVRVGGIVRCGSSLDLGRLRLDCAFLAWGWEGQTVVGRYDIVRSA